MKKYNLINNVFGWLSFAIAAVVYLMTIEPTASFWDCGEFITSAYKLEVGHPPGAPFFMLTGNFFSLFASDVSQVAMMVNAMSAIMSALTILFLFWTITHLAKKLIYQDDKKEMSLGQTIAIIGSGLVGSLAYAFSDTFWFSAVEGEVYAYSSMFTALVFWLILKWENAANKPKSDKWLILIAYVMGLSIGVHLLNLLCIPAIVLVYYYKKTEKASFVGSLSALAVSFGLIIALMYGVIPGFTKVGGWFEMFFVNSLGFSYNSGAFFYIILLVGLVIWGLFETISEKGNMTRAKVAFVLCMALAGVTFISSSWVLWLLLIAGFIGVVFMTSKVTQRLLNTSMLCLLVILIGYSSFALIPIRSIANTPMDQNSPEDVFSLADYLNREQYGDTPLFYGRTYASETKRDASRRPVETSTKNKFDKIVKKSPDEKDRYFVANTSSSYATTNNMFFPRMHASRDMGGFKDYMKGYENWGGVTDASVPPTFMQNMRFLFSYQLDFMYWRYFMWNFSGRQNDKQNRGGISNGNWITGISFIDELRGLGPQDNLPPDIAENKAHNVYYMLPLLLGIVGLVFQLTRGKKGEQQFWVTFMLFFMTGIAIVLYLNQKPYEPRERDYAYAGSFYAFSIWIGLGVAGIWILLKKLLSDMPAAAIATVVTLLIPIQMISQNWDDHDRSDRYTMRDFGMNYLRSCKPNAILFTNGDNDTFPLWYAQEVEGFRTDVRVCNLSYLQTDWYVDQMRRQAYESSPLPIEWEKDKYIGDKGQYAYIFTRAQIVDGINRQIQSDQNLLSRMQGVDYTKFYDATAYKDTVDLSTVMTNLRTNDRYTPLNPYLEGNDIQYIVPSNLLSMTLDTAAIDWADLGTKPASKFLLNLGDKQVVYRQELMIMEMLANLNKENWKRPIYFAVTVGPDMYMNMRNNFMLEGLNYRITPGVTPETGVNTEETFDNMVNKFKWGGIENPKVYLDENNLRMSQTYRMMFSQLIVALLEEGKKDKAKIALDKCMTAIPANTVPMGEESVVFASVYYRLGEPKKAEAILKTIGDRAERTINWYNRLKPSQMANCTQEIAGAFETLHRVNDVYAQNGKLDLSQASFDVYFKYAELYFRNGVAPLGNFVLQNITDGAIRRYYMAEQGSPAQEVENATTQKSMEMMRKYSPALFDQYEKRYLKD